jgi:hypothetical protein
MYPRALSDKDLASNSQPFDVGGDNELECSTRTLSNSSAPLQCCMQRACLGEEPVDRERPPLTASAMQSNGARYDGPQVLVYCVMQYIPLLMSITRSPMPSSRRPKVKTATLTLRLDPKIKAAAEAAAEHDHRSLTSLVEVLIVTHCKKLGLSPERFTKESLQ